MKKVLVTGATRGIGRACAERFAAGGYAVTGVARGAVERFPGTLVCCDLGHVSGVNRVPRDDYDAIVLNAGQYAPGGLLDSGVYDRTLFPNVLANYYLSKRLLPDMRERGHGQVVVVGSTGTDHFKPHMTAYVATKYALRGLFLGWERELEGSGVITTLLAPGSTLTSSWENEQPPADILSPGEVADRIWRAVRDREPGRITYA